MEAKLLSVLKFGGQTISSIDKMNKIAIHVLEMINEGKDVVVVVSAIGKETDELIELAAGIEGCGHLRELDHLLCTGEIKAASLMAMALINHGINAMSLNFSKLGIYTDNNHFSSKITRIDVSNIKELVNKKVVPVVPGFQGINENFDVSTLGRGGSDITAIVLAAATEADECILYKDVGGIFNDDPKINDKATMYEYLNYSSLINMLSNGSKVVNIDAIEFAKLNNIKISIACPETFKVGTRVLGGL